MSQLTCRYVFRFRNTFCGQTCWSDPAWDGAHRYDVCAFTSHAQECMPCLHRSCRVTFCEINQQSVINIYTPHVACEPAICEKLRILLCVSLLDFLLSIASLPDLNFFLSLPLWNCDIFDIGFDFSTSSCYFHPVWNVLWVVCGPLGFCGDLYSVPHVSKTYLRGPPFLRFV